MLAGSTDLVQAKLADSADNIRLANLRNFTKCNDFAGLANLTDVTNLADLNNSYNSTNLKWR